MRRASGVCVIATVLASCAGPPLTLYTFATPQTVAAPGVPATVIAIDRVSLPDYLDTTDILVRNGNALKRSASGRFGTRLSLGVTDLLTAIIGSRRPDAVVTDQPQARTPAVRVLVNIGRLDIAAAGTASVEADWLFVPADRTLPERRGRGTFEASGAVATDLDVVHLEEAAISRLGDAVAADLGPAR